MAQVSCYTFIIKYFEASLWLVSGIHINFVTCFDNVASEISENRYGVLALKGPFHTTHSSQETLLFLGRMIFERN